MSGTATPTATWVAQLTGYRMATILVGDNLKAIALRELGAASQWVTLANVNNLNPPYIVDNLAGVTGPGILVAGQTIMIPAPAAAQTVVTTQADLYGIDLELVGGMLTADANGDIQTVSGLANLEQAINHVLITRKLELIYHPAYGNDTFNLLGHSNGPADLQLAEAWTSAAIAADPRVQEVQNVTATTAGDDITVTATVVAVTGKPLPVGVTIGT